MMILKNFYRYCDGLFSKIRTLYDYISLYLMSSSTNITDFLPIAVVNTVMPYLT